MKQKVFTENAPKPIGPYSQAIIAQGKFLFISGQIPLNPNGEIIGNDIKSQTKKVLENIKAILTEAGYTMENVVKTTVLLKDMGDFKDMNEIYAQYFGDSAPARAAYQVVKLPLDVLVEIEAVAVID